MKEEEIISQQLMSNTDKLIDFLQNIEKDFDVPQVSTNDDFKLFLESNFESYIYKLKNSHLFNLEQIEIVNLLAFKIIETLDYYFKGQLKEAHDTFFNQLNKILTNGKSISDLLLEVQGITPKSHSFYRIVKLGENEKDECTSNRIFHIPFSMRHIVSSQRFSISGFPSLYLGDTIKICLDELEICLNSDLNKVYASQYKPNKDLKFMWLMRIKDILKFLYPIDDNYIKSNFGKISNFIITYPLVLACLVKVKQSKGKFKPEYIIPQMLLQYVKNDSRQLDGICYPSTKMNYEVFQELTTYNFVMPPRVFKNDYCEYLRSHFLISNPQPLKNIIKPIQNTNYKNSIYQTIEDNLSKFQAE